MLRTAGLSALFALSACSGPAGTDLNGVVEAYLKALGGRETLEGIESVHTLDSLSMAGLSGVSEAWWIREPFMGRVRVSLGPVEQNMLFMGDSVWSLDRNGNLTPAGRDGLSQLESARATVFNTAFLRNEGLEYLGDSLVSGERVSLVLLELDTPVVYCFSQESGLPVALITTAMGVTMVQYPGGFTVIDGVTTALSTRDVLPEMGMESTSRNILTEFNTAELFHDSIFSLIPGAPDWELTLSGTPVPFQLHGGHIYMNARVNGREALAVLDSGAGATLLDSTFARELGLLPEGAFRAQGLGGTQQFSFAPVDSYEVAGAILSGQMLAVLPIRDAFLPATGRSIDMILGYDFLSRFIAEIDYPAGTLTLHRPGGYSPPPCAIRVEGELTLSLISFEAVIEDSIPATLLLDTGAGGTLHLTGTFLEGRGGTLAERPFREAQVEAVGGGGTVRLFPVESLTIAGVTIPCGEASVFDDSGPLSRYDGILGSGILSRYTLVLDYSMPGFLLIPSGDDAIR